MFGWFKKQNTDENIDDELAPFIGKSLDEIDDKVNLLRLILKKGFSLMDSAQVIVVQAFIIFELKKDIMELKDKLNSMQGQ